MSQEHALCPMVSHKPSPILTSTILTYFTTLHLWTHATKHTVSGVHLCLRLASIDPSYPQAHVPAPSLHNATVPARDVGCALLI